METARRGSAARRHRSDPMIKYLWGYASLTNPPDMPGETVVGIDISKTGSREEHCR
jgi:hypothetical protein